MDYKYNTRYYFNNKLHQIRPKAEAISTFIMSDGTLIAMFQGSRGTHPDLDFRIKILKTGKNSKPQQPRHIYWVVDLMIKAQLFPKQISEIIKYYINFYDTCTPFRSVEERAVYKPTTVEYILKNYGNVICNNTLPIDYTAYILELFSLCEKQNEGAKMFRGLLTAFDDYINHKIDYMSLLEATLYPYQQKKSIVTKR